MLVYIQQNYDYPNLIRQTPNLSGAWSGIQFTYEEVDTCDLIVVINHPQKDIKVKCRKGGRILLIQEPPYERNNYLTNYFPYFDKIISAFDKQAFEKVMNTQAALPWLINKSYDQLIDLKPDDSLKNDKISWVTSNSNVNPGHQPRLQFLDTLKQSDVNIDFFGRGINPIEDKFEGIYPYRYTLAIENYSNADYWTEKIADAFLCYTMPIYYGCKNIEDFFPKGSFIKIDINKQEEAIEIMKDALKNKLWETNKEAIIEARNLVLNKYQFFPFIKELTNSLKLSDTYTVTNIPFAPQTRKNKIVEKIRNLFQ